MPTVEGKPETGKQKRQTGPRYDNVLMGPGKYEVHDKSTFVVEIYLKCRKEEGGDWWLIVEKKDAEVTERVVFRMWKYDEIVEMRKLATKYDTVRRVHMIDHDVLNRLKIQKLMRAWTFGKDNPRLSIHHVHDVLSDESWEAINRLQTNILKYIMDQMNERYEYGN